MFLQTTLLHTLKRMAVSEGRASRQDFLLKGLLPFILSMFALFAAPGVPWLAELGLVLLIAAVYFSRAALAQAIRRCNDIGLDPAYLKSFKHQSGAYFQIFFLMIVATAFQAANRSEPVSIVIAAGCAATAVSVLLGGLNSLRVLATAITGIERNAHGAPAPGTMKALGFNAPTPGPTPQAPAPTPRTPRATLRPPERPSLPLPKSHPTFASSTHKPKVIPRRRNIGEWTAPK